MSWWWYISRRLLQVLPLLIGIVVLSFLLIDLAPGDAARVLAGDRANPEYLEAIRARYGLDEPLPIRLGTYLLAVATGDLGNSLVYQRPVTDLLVERIGPTVLLMASAQLIGLIGVPLAVRAAYRRGSLFDSGVSTISLLLYSTPVFWAGLVGVLVFSVYLGWLPTSGMSNPLESGQGPLAVAIDLGRHLLLPAMTLALVWYLPESFKITRASAIEVLREDFVTTATASGVPERSIVYRHVLRNAALPTITLIGLNAGLGISGAVITETVFGWPGLGRLVYESIGSRDYPVLLGILILTGLAVAVLSLLTDLVYGLIDPRVRLQRAAS